MKIIVGVCGCLVGTAGCLAHVLQGLVAVPFVQFLALAVKAVSDPSGLFFFLSHMMYQVDVDRTEVEPSLTKATPEWDKILHHLKNISTSRVFADVDFWTLSTVAHTPPKMCMV